MNICLNADQKISSATMSLDERPILPRYKIDGIECIVNGSQRKRIICESDIKRASLGGNQPGASRFDKIMHLVTEELSYQDALRYKIPIDDSVIYSYIDSISKKNNWSLEDVKSVFKASGYHTFEEGFEQLRIMYGSNAMIDGKVKQNLFIPEAQVIAYYNDHPEIEEAQFKIKIGLAPFSLRASKEELLAEINDAIEKKNEALMIWKPAFWLKKSEIAEELSFITTMNAGDISAPQESKEGFEVYSIVKKKPEYLVPLKKRYAAIVDQLMRPKFEKLYAAYKQSLLDNASIVFFDTEKDTI